MTTAATDRDDASPRWPTPTVVVGLLLVVGGVLVLRSPGARDVSFGWFAYAPAPSTLDGLTAWNSTRELGAGLVVLGSVLVVLAAATLLAGRRRVRAGVVRVVVVVGVLLVAAGATAFRVLATVAQEGDTVSIGKATGPFHRVSYASTVWTPGQLGAGLVVGVGLLVLAAAVGLRTGREVSAPASVRRTSS